MSGALFGSCGFFLRHGIPKPFFIVTVNTLNDRENHEFERV